MALVHDAQPAARARRARAAYIEIRGEVSAVGRQQQIDALPTVEWKGRTLYVLRCNGTSGKGPHLCNVPLALLWSLIDFRAFRCPYHAGDAVAS